MELGTSARNLIQAAAVSRLARAHAPQAQPVLENDASDSLVAKSDTGRDGGGRTRWMQGAMRLVVNECRSLIRLVVQAALTSGAHDTGSSARCSRSSGPMEAPPGESLDFSRRLLKSVEVLAHQAHLPAARPEATPNFGFASIALALQVQRCVKRVITLGARSCSSRRRIQGVGPPLICTALQKSARLWQRRAQSVRRCRVFGQLQSTHWKRP
jgi:hypothetical protein